MLEMLILLGLFVLPLVGATLAPSPRNLGRAPTSMLMGGLLLWVILLWALALHLAWPWLEVSLRSLWG